MRTTIDIDDTLLKQALERASGKTKKAVVEEALREYVNAKRRLELIAMIGTDVVDLTPEELRQMRGCDESPLSD